MEEKRTRLNYRMIIFFACLLAVANIVIFFFSFSQTSENRIIPDGTVMHFDFGQPPYLDGSSEKVIDSSGNGHDGTIENAIWNSTGGPDGNGSFEFNGVNASITVPDSKSFSISTTGELSVALWIRFGTTNFTGEGSERDYIHFMGKGGSGNDYEWMWRQYNSSNADGRSDRISFYVFNKRGGLGSGSYVQEPIKVGEWMFFVGVVRNKQVEFWKNGVLQGSQALSDYSIKPEHSKAPLEIGTTDNDSYFKGSIADIRIYDRALSEEEINKLYGLR